MHRFAFGVCGSDHTISDQSQTTIDVRRTDSLSQTQSRQTQSQTVISVVVFEWNDTVK